MVNQTATLTEQTQSLASQVASHHEILPHHITPFFDFADAVTYFCTTCVHQRASFWSVGHLFPDLEIAADRAGMRPVELLGTSPFSGDVDVLTQYPIQPTDLLWVSNPNRITGANYGLHELARMAEMIPEGWLVIDEHYPAFFGISAASLLHKYDNIVLICPIGQPTYSAGFMATTNNRALEQFRSGERKLIPAARQQAMQALIAETNDTERTELINDETLRLALKLNRLGVRSWITATDFLLVRFADPTTAGNMFATHTVAIENLSGYPQLSGYLRYQIQSHAANDRFIEAVTRMPEQVRISRSLDMDNRPFTVEPNRLTDWWQDDVPEQTTRESIFVTESVDADE